MLRSTSALRCGLYGPLAARLPAAGHAPVRSGVAVARSALPVARVITGAGSLRRSRVGGAPLRAAALDNAEVAENRLPVTVRTPSLQF